jgi:hypothetical protein
VGLALFPALALALVLANAGALPFAVVLMVAGFFSHNLLDDRTSLLAIALAAGAEARVAGTSWREREAPGGAAALAADERLAER